MTELTVVPASGADKIDKAKDCWSGAEVGSEGCEPGCGIGASSKEVSGCDEGTEVGGAPVCDRAAMRAASERPLAYGSNPGCKTTRELRVDGRVGAEGTGTSTRVATGVEACEMAGSGTGRV